MADTKISALTETKNIEDSYLAAALGGSSYKLSLGQLVRNHLLNLANMSKALASSVRVLETFADGYKASDGVSSGSSSNYSVNTTSGYVGPTTTDTRISGGTPTSPNFGGTAANFNDNNTGTSITNSISFGALGSATVPQRIFLQLDYGSNKTIDRIDVVGVSISSTSDTGTGVYYSTDGTNWTQYGTNFSTITTSPQTFSRTGTSVTARYIALVASATNWSTVTMTVQDFNGYSQVPNNMTLVTASQTADASVSNARCLLEIDPIDSITLGTDLTIELTCNGGTNYTAAGTYTNCGKGQGGRTVIETDDVSCTSGTSFAARIKTLNNKNVNVYKTTVTVH